MGGFDGDLLVSLLLKGEIRRKCEGRGDSVYPPQGLSLPCTGFSVARPISFSEFLLFIFLFLKSIFFHFLDRMFMDLEGLTSRI